MSSHYLFLLFPLQIIPSPRQDLLPACLAFPLRSPRRTLCSLSSVCRHLQTCRTWCPRCLPSIPSSWEQEEYNDSQKLPLENGPDVWGPIRANQIQNVCTHQCYEGIWIKSSTVEQVRLKPRTPKL